MIARLEVTRGTLTEYPLAEKVRGGWQNGVTFYPDADVTKITPLSVVPEEPEGRRFFTAAYRAQNGNVIPLGLASTLRSSAQATVNEFAREDDEGPDYFLATRILPPWLPVEHGDE